MNKKHTWGMDQSSIPSTRANGKKKNTFKDLNLGRSQTNSRESPESGSLFSDYESGQQYEDKVGFLLKT